MQPMSWKKQQKKCQKLEKKKNKWEEKAIKAENKSQSFAREKEELERVECIPPTEAEKIKADKKAARREHNQQLNSPPALPILEEVGNAVTHGVGALWAIAALVLMLLKSDTTLKCLSSCVYGLSLFFMMLSSCLYHSFKSGSKVKRIFRRFDYSSIYLLIGGTFAPLLLVYLGNIFGIVVFAVQWAAIITGITMVCVFGPGRLKWLHFPLYFVIGWSGLLFIPDWIQNNLPLLWFILGGGIVYTVGMIPFVFRGKKAAHFIWHFFVLVGAVVQFVGIYLFVY
jgi:hemolysin III